MKPPTKTSLRLAAEAAVIVVSILLAFGIDAAWDYRLERQDEAELLESLREEFVRMGAKAREDGVEIDRRRENAERGLSLTSTELARLETDSIRPLLMAPINRSFVNELPFPALSSALSSGRLDLIQNEELRTALSGVQQRNEDLDEFRGLLSTLSVEAAVAARRHEGMPFLDGGNDYSAVGPQTLQAVRADPEVFARVSAKIFYWRPFAAALTELADEVDDAVALMDAELGVSR